MAAREILASSLAGHPRGVPAADELAQQFRDQGVPATVVQDLPGNRFLVISQDGGERP
ncbi:hypothetical protein ACIRU8_39320 [Streptomyces sp. NPDC101175]|uniref:hypothetical protein n=1 Tax=Streptomyces sp. NPDC101175 TaxID=3366123 RepID=UPI0038369F0E